MSDKIPDLDLDAPDVQAVLSVMKKHHQSNDFPYIESVIFSSQDLEEDAYPQKIFIGTDESRPIWCYIYYRSVVGHRIRFLQESQQVGTRRIKFPDIPRIELAFPIRDLVRNEINGQMDKEEVNAFVKACFIMKGIMRHKPLEVGRGFSMKLGSALNVMGKNLNNSDERGALEGNMSLQDTMDGDQPPDSATPSEATESCYIETRNGRLARKSKLNMSNRSPLANWLHQGTSGAGHELAVGSEAEASSDEDTEVRKEILEVYLDMKQKQDKQREVMIRELEEQDEDEKKVQELGEKTRNLQGQLHGLYDMGKKRKKTIGDLEDQIKDGRKNMKQSRTQMTGNEGFALAKQLMKRG